MITRVDAQGWDAADLTGNSAIVPVGTDLYLVGGRRGDDTQAVYRSADAGRTWATVATIPSLRGSLDPAMAVDSDGLLHIVTSRPSPSVSWTIDVLKYTYSTVTQAFVGDPVVLIEQSKAQAAYDIVALGAGASLVVTAAVESKAFPANYVLLAFEIAADRTFTTATLESSPMGSGRTFGGVSLVFPGGSAPVELYVTAHARSHVFKDTVTDVLRRDRTSAGVWGSTWADISSGGFTSRFTDDKLTVVPTLDGKRLLSTAFHRQVRGVLQTSVFYGVGTQDPGTLVWAWRFSTLECSPYQGFREPLMASDGANAYLIYLQSEWLADSKRYARDGGLRVASVDPGTLVLASHEGPWESLRFKWLRGTKAQQDPVTRWMVLGIQGLDTDEASGGLPTFLSEFNLPPVVSVSPVSATLQRGVALVLDASATQDPDLDSMTFSWGHNSPDTKHVHVTPLANGRKAQVFVDKAIGPSALDFSVTVSVNDGHHPSVTASVAISVPVDLPPVITLDATKSIERNTRVALHATVTDAEDTCTYMWQQVAGTPVSILDSRTLNPVIEAFRLDPGGEILKFRLLVQDGVNSPASAEIALVAPAMSLLQLDTGIYVREFYTRYYSPQM